MPTDETWTYRPRSAVPLTVASWVVVAGFVLAEAYGSGAAAVLRALPLALAVAGLAWLSFARPRVVVDGSGILVVNPFVTTRVPWSALIDISTRYTCTFVTPSRSVQAFAAPGPGRHIAVTSTADDLGRVGPGALDAQRSAGIGELPRSASGTVAGYVRRRWVDLVENGQVETGTADDVELERRVDVVAAAVVGGLAVLGVVLLALA